MPHIDFLDGYVRSDWDHFDGHRGKTIERVQYLAKRRNGAIEKLVSEYRETTDILMVDSYYLNQQNELGKLCESYASLGPCILGASTWADSYLYPYRRKMFWDTWTTPECRLSSFNSRGRIRVNAVGGAILFPRSVWEMHKFDVSAFPRGCEVNSLCELSRLPVFLDFDVKLFHTNPKRYSFWKSMRVYQGRYRRGLFGR